MIKIRGRLSLLAAAAVIAGGLLQPATVAATIKSPPWADTFGNYWNDGLNTYEASTNAYNALKGIGYFTTNNKDTNAVTSMSAAWAQSDAVWVDFGHGGPGFISFCSPAQGSACTTILRSDSSVGRCNSGDTCLANYWTTTCPPGVVGPCHISLIHNIKLMVFAGCHTGQTASSGSNLVSYAVNTMGVDASIGFTDYVYFGGFTHPGETWSNSFFQRLKAGDSVTQAQTIAQNDVKNVIGAFGGGSGWDTAYIINGGIKITPRGYGN